MESAEVSEEIDDLDDILGGLEATEEADEGDELDDMLGGLEASEEAEEGEEEGAVEDEDDLEELERLAQKKLEIL